MNLTAFYILISVGIGALGQVLLKKGMNDMGPLSLSLPWNQLGGVLWRVATNPYVFIGLAIYLVSMVFWLIALSHVDLSYAYPFASLSYGIMLIASWIFFSESITPLRLVGTLIICMGVLVISRG
jgi:drug/metabolite transporter (DMT)-like permease